MKDEEENPHLGYTYTHLAVAESPRVSLPSFAPRSVSLSRESSLPQKSL